MHLPNYLKCLVNVKNPPLVLVIDVYFYLVYYSYLYVSLCFSLFSVGTA